MRSFLFWGVFAAFKYKIYIVTFFPDEIVLASLTSTGEIIEDYKIFSKEEIQKNQVKKGLLNYKAIIWTNEKKTKLMFSRVILTIPWQKENIAYLKDKGWYIEKLNN